MDTDGDGKISFDEYAAMKDELPLHELQFGLTHQDIFNMIDTDGDGTYTKEQGRTFFKDNLPQYYDAGKYEEYFKFADADGDGKIHFAEFERGLDVLPQEVKDAFLQKY